jgi:hypothetical protein
MINIVISKDFSGMKNSISSNCNSNLIAILTLTIATLAVFWQGQNDNFTNLDAPLRASIIVVSHHEA